MIIKKLKLGGLEFYPQTADVAVIVGRGDSAERLDLALARKLEEVESEDLTITRQGAKVNIIHSNNITPNDKPSSLLVLYDEHGHIIAVDSTKALKISVSGIDYISYEGSEERELKLDDNFEVKNNYITLHWNNIKQNGST